MTTPQHRHAAPADAGARLLPYADRASAGTLLARWLLEYREADTLVLGIPRGGVPVAAAVARAIGAELDVVVARKLGAPRHPEFAIGAVTADGTRFLDEYACAELGVSPEYVEEISRVERDEARRRERRFRGDRPPPRVRGRPVIVVDDGLATGATAIAAIEMLRRAGADQVVVAAPVGAREACRTLAALADDVVCPAQPDPFLGVGAFYRSFPQLHDAEVEAVLARWREARGGTRSP